MHTNDLASYNCTKYCLVLDSAKTKNILPVTVDTKIEL